MTGIVFSCLVPHPPIIVPDIGRGEEKKISATSNAMEEMVQLLARHRPDTVIIISPHGNYLNDAMGISTGPSSDGDLNSWGVRGLKVHFENDPDLVELIQKEARQNEIPLQSISKHVYNLDHGIMVPMYFLHRALKGVPLIPLTFSWLPLKTHFEFGKVIKNASEQSNKRVAIIASGDLSHRLIPGAPAGYDLAGKIFDEQLAKSLADMDAKGILNYDQSLIERAGECGLRSIVIMLGALDGLNVTPDILSYEGPFGVGYMVASFEVKPKSSGK
jgi:aromatic ring-opening dioxygenase LigB subunit